MASAPRKPEREIAELAASNSATLSPEEIYRLIREAAYYKAEARQFSPGVELQDWLEAEKEVMQRLQAP